MQTQIAPGNPHNISSSSSTGNGILAGGRCMGRSSSIPGIGTAVPIVVVDAALSSTSSHISSSSAANFEGADNLVTPSTFSNFGFRVSHAFALSLTVRSLPRLFTNFVSFCSFTISARSMPFCCLIFCPRFNGFAFFFLTPELCTAEFE